MRTVLMSLGRAVGVVLGAVLAAGAQGQDVKPAVRPAEGGGGVVHRMEIRNGPTTAVRYFSTDVTEGDRSVLRELERASNEARYAGDLQALLRQYVNDERLLEPKRRTVQAALYGQSITASSFGSGVGPAYAGYGAGPVFVGYGAAYPYAYPYNYGGYAFGYPYAYPGAVFGGGSLTTTESLAFGVGDEGRMKEALVQVLARQATPEYAAAANRAYDNALARAASSAVIRPVLGPDERGRVKGAAFERPQPSAVTVTLTLKGGGKVAGDAVREDGDWYVVESGGEEVSRVRQGEVTRIDRAKKAKPGNEG
jgi:hypothetical protein